MSAGIIERKEYLDFLMRHRGKPVIKVVSGIRRSGKSTLFEIYKNALRAEGVPDGRMISVNFEDIAFEELTDYHKLYEYVCARLTEGETTYVFLDEVQNAEHFEKAVDSLYIKDGVDIYITGSNAYFMSGELATLLSGRYVELRMLPLSFAEFCSVQPGGMTLGEKYERYITRSSFPYVAANLTDEADIREYLQGLYSTIVLKDVAHRGGISDLSVLESVIRFVADNIGNRLSPTGIANAMTSAGRKIDGKTVERYLRALEDSLFVYRANRYNIKGKQLLRLQEKYYLADVAFRFLLLGGRGLDVGHVLKNAVYLELVRRGYDVFVGQAGRAEVDFVALRGGGCAYFQVSASVRDPEVLERELAPLKSVTDSYPKFLLTLDDDPNGDYNGIMRMNALRFLLGDPR